MIPALYADEVAACTSTTYAGTAQIAEALDRALPMISVYVIGSMLVALVLFDLIYFGLHKLRTAKP